MSGYGGYGTNFETWVFESDAGTVNNITEKSFTITSIKKVNYGLPYKNLQGYNKLRIKASGINEGYNITYGNNVFETVQIKNGINDLSGEYGYNDKINVGFRSNKIIENCNITIEVIPEYEGALVFDGVDDYVSLDAFDSGFKTMFIECSYVSLNTILYDQRKVGTEQEDCINTSAYEAGFYGRNKYGKTYINGVYNKPDSTLIASKLSNKHILITSTFKGDYTSTPCIASSNVNKGMYCNMALYKLLGFKEALTKEQIQAVIKKYNLLDGVDEIEVS